MSRAWVLALAVLSGTFPAQAADLPGPIYVPGNFEADSCAAAPVLNAIVTRFAWAERNTWHRGYVIASLDNPRSSNHPYFEPGLIRRDYCMADSVMTNGEFRTVYYAIEHGVGFASLGNYVDFCVLGLDPWRVHDGACRTVQ